ncbi:MAG TPA: AAA family ATPase, partial [Burkholderiaceae bacterium]|nr:AAA family ATPase [Burkholderiaceae bacterium]
SDDNPTRLAKLAAFLPEGLRRSDDALPLLGSLLAVDAPTAALAAMSPQHHRQRLLQVLIALLREHAQRGPVLLVVEDLHWIDPSSDELIGQIVDALPTLPLLLVLTARPEFHSPWDERAHLQQLALAPLDRDETRTMIGLLCGERALPAATVEQIAERTDGLPLFVEDLTRDLLEHDVALAAGAQPVAAAGIPATLSDSLMSRLDRLGSAKAVAQVGAVIGREFSHELLAKVAGRDEETLREELLRLVVAGLLVSRRPGAVPVYAFKHVLVRDAAYASLLKKESAALHGRIARALAEDFTETAASEPEVLANHYAAAHDDANAVHYLVQAAKLSARRCGFAEAIAQLERALRVLAAQPASPQRTRLELRVQLALGGVYAEHRGFASAPCASAYDRALALCRELDDPPEIFAVLSGIGAVEITRAGFARCRALAEETLQRAAGQSALSPYVMGHLLLGGTQFLCGELDAARRNLDEALRIYEQQHAAGRPARQVMYVQDQKSTGLCYLALALTIGGRPAAGRRAALQGLAHSEGLGGAHTVNFSLCYLAAALHIQRDREGALARGLQSLQAARDQGFATWIGPSEAIVGAQRVQRGEVEAGLEQISEGIRDYTGTQALAYQPFWIALRAEGLAAAGRLHEARAALDDAIGIALRHGERFYLAELLRFKGEILAREGRAGDSERCLDDALRLARSQQAGLFELRTAATLCRTLDGARRKAAFGTLLAPLLQGVDEADRDAHDVVEARALLAEAGG